MCSDFVKTFCAAVPKSDGRKARTIRTRKISPKRSERSPTVDLGRQNLTKQTEYPLEWRSW